jgi:hypothetical protein
MDEQFLMAENGDSEEMAYWQDRLAGLDDLEIEAEIRRLAKERHTTNKALWDTNGRGFQAVARRETLRLRLRALDRALAIVRFERLQRRRGW